MQAKIHLLSDETINQIAAGEVIESPASVVKELIENALDAEAKKITIEITGGGMKMIRISDDGTGMGTEDAIACILRHATSKISKAQDLFHIGTKGFRGEALASVASIAKMTISTALEQMTGLEIEIEKGEITRERPCARTKGTTIEVRSLFYNVPARKKFQKSAAAISAEIFRMVTILALSHPDVHFELISNGRKAIQTLAKDLQGRAEELLGEEFVAGSFSVAFTEGPLHFTGLIGAPTNTRANKMGQYLFLNRRGVVCEPIYEAVRAGYGTRLEERRHPIFLLHLDVPADLVDVNVHPQKLHVRLRKETLFRSTVEEAVKNALSTKTEISTATAQKNFTPTHVQFEKTSFRLQEDEPVQELFLEDSLLFLGQIGPYLLYNKEDELVFLNAKAASFRTLFENLKNKPEKISQGLLVPFSIALTPVESAMVLTHLNAIEDMGFALRPIGKDTFMVEAIPPFLDESNIQAIIADIAHSLQQFIGGRDYTEERQEKLALIAASSAKKKTTYLPEEAKELFKQLQLSESPLHCPKGNPTMVKLTNDEIEELFRADQKTAKSS
ncbi:MAG: DNA mismatch repair protein MutL [Chlamydiae bacterium]|nr:DNA mismatch repair protein MutL [Chlamydiota bacterium]